MSASMILPFENQLIGYFLVRLGEKRAVQTQEISAMSVELAQQTPMDKSIGDLRALIDGQNIIIEFKRNRENLRAEFDRLAMLDEELDGDENIGLRAISMDSHFLAYGELADDERLRIYLQRYLKMCDDDERLESEDFLDAFVLGKARPRKTAIGYSGEDFDSYLKLLDKIWGDSRSQKAIASAPALFLCRKGGQFFPVVAPSMLELTETFWKIKLEIESPGLPHRIPPPIGRAPKI